MKIILFFIFSLSSLSILAADKSCKEQCKDYCVPPMTVCSYSTDAPCDITCRKPGEKILNGKTLDSQSNEDVKSSSNIDNKHSTPTSKDSGPSLNKSGRR